MINWKTFARKQQLCATICLQELRNIAIISVITAVQVKLSFEDLPHVKLEYLVSLWLSWRCLSASVYEVVSKGSRTVMVVTASVKVERGGQGHTSSSLLHQSAT
jgi:hypothetical protein